MEEEKQIKCSIFYFKNETIEKITEAVNNAEDIQDKTRLALDLAHEVESLLTCKYFNEKRVDCRICRKLSEIRKQTTELIIKAQEFKK
ncbi:MAG: hypothetical protein AB1465_04415 [Patescibacteria group bacterium]